MVKPPLVPCNCSLLVRRDRQPIVTERFREKARTSVLGNHDDNSYQREKEIATQLEKCRLVPSFRLLPWSLIGLDCEWLFREIGAIFRYNVTIGAWNFRSPKHRYIGCYTSHVRRTPHLFNTYRIPRTPPGPGGILTTFP